MAVVKVDIKLSVTFLREGKKFIAYSPALDLSTSGKSLKEAKKRFEEASTLFIEELNKKGTTTEVLKELGWTVGDRRLTPPVIVGHDTQAVRVPVMA